MNQDFTWKKNSKINVLLSRKKKTYMIINYLKQPHTNITTNLKSRIPNILNEYFTNVGPSLANKLPPFEKHFTEYLDKKKSPVTSFFITSTSPIEVKLKKKTNHMVFTRSLSAYLNMQVKF